MDFADLTALPVEAEALEALGHDYAAQFIALPIKKSDGVLWAAVPDPQCHKTLADLAAVTGLFIEPVKARESDIRYRINQVYGAEAIHTIASQFIVEEKLRQQPEPDPALLEELNAAPAVRLIDSLINLGVLNRASDLHIEPYGDQLRARYRVDGELLTYGTVDISLLPNVVSRLKVMGGMDIAEKRLPQDGAFTMPVLNEPVDFRLSTILTLYGEKAVIRLLYGGATRLKKEELGFSATDLECLTHLFRQPFGALIITGPTGSGKSTTLSVFLEELNEKKCNIVTVEDPVENPLLGVNHINVAQTGGLGFSGALKHILRQDPDVIMIGEMRDEETARIAIQAAMTGHVVLTTLHTNDAAGVIERLTDMGVAPYLAAAALNGIISQRLVRRICPECSTPARLTPEQSFLLTIDPETPVFKGKGCNHCYFSGYSGRFAVYEYIIMTEKHRRRMSKKPARFAMKMRKKKGLRQNVLQAMLEGRTSADEAVKALHRDG